MLDKIRQATKGWFAWVIIGALAIVFTLWGVYGYLGVNAAGGQTAATVNGTDISLKAVSQLVQQMQQQAVAAGQPDVDLPALRKQALEELIMQTLLIQDAKNRQFVAEKKLVDQVILNQPEFQVEGKFSPEKFVQVSRQLGYLPAQLRQLMDDELIVKQLQAGIMASALVLPTEVEYFLKSQKQQRDWRYLTIPVSIFSPKASPDEKTIEAYYQAHIKNWVTPEYVSVEYVELTRDTLADKISITDSEINKEYTENQAAYTQAEERELAYILLKTSTTADATAQEKAQTLADELVKRLAAGEDFTQLAKQYSTDPLSAEKGGYLGWLTPGTLSAELDKPVFTAQVGALIGPLKTPYGLELVKVLAVRPAITQPLSAVRQNIAEQLLTQRVQQRYVELEHELATLAYEIPDSLEEIAKSLNVPLQTTTLFSRQGGVEPITRHAQIQQAAFSEAVLAGENSEVLMLEPQHAVVLRVKDYQPAATLPLQAVRSAVVAAIQQEAAQQAAVAQLSTWVTQLTDGAISPSTVAQQTKVEWKTAKNLTRSADANSVPVAVRDYAFSLSRPIDSKTPTAGWKALNATQYLLVQLTHVQEGQVPAEGSEEWNNAEFALTLLQQQMDYTAYLEQLRDTAAIDYHVELTDGTT